MDPKHTTEMFKHLEKQNELLMDAYRTMFHEQHRLQVEEEMLMHKLYELMSAEGLLTKTKDTPLASKENSNRTSEENNMEQ